MAKRFLSDSIKWGFLLWLTGYILGIILFMLVPPHLIGWVIMPIGTAITLWVLLKKISAFELSYYFKLGAVWTLIAVILDYLFIIRLLNPEDGYYKPSVYLYYSLTLLLPLLVGWYKARRV
jgi:hypothetical protein